ncbi:adenylyltransferase/cytidyltransferase family protein [Candidatus Woesebacteria bacterium]|nr:adenylyltransferase/cytidyltransferase family protein [Candidatus Woesebacteria bacterium]
MHYSIKSFAPIATQLRNTDNKLVLATGFFDLLHEEHINFLNAAKKAGDILVVAVESDERARVLKGEGRPVETQSTRLDHLTPYADYLIALDKDFNNPAAFESLIASVRPTILAVSSHTAHQDKKTKLVEKYGGELQVVYTHNPAVSTTNIIQQSKL